MNYQNLVVGVGALAGGLVLGAAGLSRAAPAWEQAPAVELPKAQTPTLSKTSPVSAVQPNAVLATSPSSTSSTTPSQPPVPGEVSIRFTCRTSSEALHHVTRCEVPIPAGKQLIIKSYSVDTWAAGTSMVYLLLADYRRGATYGERFYLPTPQSFPPMTSGSATTHIVLDGGGHQVPWLGIHTESRSALAHAVFFGSLVDAPESLLYVPKPPDEEEEN